MAQHPNILLEVAVDSVEGAAAAEEGGAGRIELCSGLDAGGLTPSQGLIEETCRAVGIPVHVMLRPRAGDFCYSPREFAVMCRDVELLKRAGASGAVFGFLDERRHVDVKRTRELLELAKPLDVTFHRAFDLTVAPERALEEIIAAGAKSILTSGQAKSAQKGINMLKRLVQLADRRIAVMAGGGVDATNIPGIVGKTGVSAVHVASSVLSEPESSPGILDHRFGGKRTVDPAKVKHLAGLLNSR